ncbi:MAG: hypothetical protein GXY33_03260 [Phycisphaerae bacterium]|mgnify:CR=1 FL=1|nr:hypothetical protein [Phycisphaerae bacterium]
MKRFHVMAFLTTCASSIMLMGCDESVQDTVIGGLEQSAQTLIAALITAAFQTLETGGTV